MGHGDESPFDRPLEFHASVREDPEAIYALMTGLQYRCNDYSSCAICSSQESDSSETDAQATRRS